MTEIAEKLKERNLKVTPQRLSIYNILNEKREHLSAEAIYNHLKPTHPTISLATVYKTLSSFVSAGIVQEFNTGDGVSRYDINIYPHPHFICNVCNCVIDLPELTCIDLVRHELNELTNYKVTNEQIFLYGICDKCDNH